MPDRLSTIDLEKVRTLTDFDNYHTAPIHGFTDEDGTSGFNDTLAQKRVNFIFQIVKDQIKIREDFKTISFGENFKHGSDKSKNRKTVIFYLLEKDIVNENEILGITRGKAERSEAKISL